MFRQLDGTIQQHDHLRNHVKRVDCLRCQYTVGLWRYGNRSTQEIAIGPTQIVWTVSGIAAGARSVTLPAGWSSQPLAQTGNTFTVQFPGGAQTAPVSIVFTQ